MIKEKDMVLEKTFYRQNLFCIDNVCFMQQQQQKKTAFLHHFFKRLLLQTYFGWLVRVCCMFLQRDLATHRRQSALLVGMVGASCAIAEVTVFFSIQCCCPLISALYRVSCYFLFVCVNSMGTME